MKGNNNLFGLGFFNFCLNSRENPESCSKLTAMAKNRNKKKNNRSSEMAVDSTAEHSLRDESQAMDTSETVATSASLGGNIRKMKKGRPMKRSKNIRKIKAVAKAISRCEKSLEKISKCESKTMRIKFANTLYD